MALAAVHFLPEIATIGPCANPRFEARSVIEEAVGPILLVIVYIRIEDPHCEIRVRAINARYDSAPPVADRQESERPLPFRVRPVLMPAHFVARRRCMTDIAGHAIREAG